MRKIGLSVIIPVYNAADWIAPTLQHLDRALKTASFDAEIIVIDDGSSDNSAARARKTTLSSQTKTTVIRQKNAGRYLARKRGVQASCKDNILFVDSRVFVGKDSLSYLYRKLSNNPDQIWNGHVVIDKKGSMFTRFWDAIVQIAWRKYFRHPRETKYSSKEFDYFPKGTGFFYVPKYRLLAAMEHFEKNTNDITHSSDDTLLIRFMNKRQDIHLSPEFNCIYHGRTTASSFFAHAYHRGEFFIDGFLRNGTRFYYPLIAVLVSSVVAAIAFVTFPIMTLAAVFALSIVFALLLFVGAKIVGVSWRDAFSLSVLGAPFACVYMVGLWRGVARKSRFINSIWEYLSKYRPFLRGNWWEYIVAATIYAVILAAITGTVSSHLTTQLYTGAGDGTAGFLWINDTDKTINPFVSHYAATNYPYGEDTNGLLLLSYLAYWLPMRLLAYVVGPVAALNLTMYGGYMFSALAMYLLVKRITAHRLAAFTAGIAAAFVPYTLIKSAGHLSYIFGGIFSLIIGAFVAFWSNPNRRKAVLVGALAGAACYFDGYFILMTTVLGCALICAALVYLVLFRFTWPEWRQRLGYALITLGTALLIVLPLGLVNVYGGKAISTELASNRSEIAQEIRTYRSNVVDFITPQAGSLIWQGNSAFQALTAYKNQRSNGSENTDYVSVAIYLVSVIGCALLMIRLFAPKHSSLTALSDTTVRYVFLVGLVSLITLVFAIAVMFSPEVTVKGITIPLPGKFLIEHNITYWRVLSRLFVLYNVAIACWAGVSLWLIATAMRQRLRTLPSLGSVTIVLVLAAVAVEYATLFPGRPFDFEKMDKTYSWLREQKDIRSIAMLPLVDPLDTKVGDYVTAQLVHDKKIINQKVPSATRLNNTLAPIASEETINLLRERHVDAAVYISRTGSCDIPQIGPIIHQENIKIYDMQERRKVDAVLCTLRVAKPAQPVDPVFAVYGSAFSPSANAPDQSDVAFRLADASLTLTYADLKTRYSGHVYITGKVRLIPNIPTATWMMTQNGREIARGIFDANHVSSFEVKADGQQDITLHIHTPNYTLKLAEAYLENVVVSKRD